MRLIDADKLLRDIEHYDLSDGKFQHWVEIQPTVEPERERGKWIKNSEKYDAITHICSVCGSTMTTLKPTIANYCWHCGAMMTRGDLDEND